MINVKKAFKSYRSAGAFNGLLAPTAFIADNIFVTKAGDVGVVLKVEGIDYECLPDTLLEEQAARFEAAIRSFDDQFRIYQYIIKRNGATVPHVNQYPNDIVNEAIRARVDYLESKRDRLFTLELYLVVLYESKRFLTNPKEKIRVSVEAALSNSKRLTLEKRSLQRISRILTSRVQSFLHSTTDFLRPEILGKRQAFTFFRKLFNLTPGKAEAVPLKFNHHIDYFMADSQMKPTETGLRMEGQSIHVYSLKEEPGTTHVNLLKDIHQLPCNAIVCSEYRRIPNVITRSKIRARQRHFDGARFSFISLMTNQPKDELIEDESANENIDQLSEALKELERGNYFGEFSLTVLLYGRDESALAKAGAEVTRIFGDLEGAVIQETQDAALVYAAIAPGGTKWQHRKLQLLNKNYVDLGFFYAIHEGHRWNKHLENEYLATYETTQNTIYYFNLHTEDLIGALIVGQPGSGKSVNANYLLTNSLKYDPYTLILDIGGSYRETTRFFGGNYTHLTLDDQNFKSNPFSLPESKDNIEFNAGLIRLLLQNGGYTVTATDREEIFRSVRNMYQVDPQHRRLGSLVRVLPIHLKQELQAWVRGGQYGTIFDNLEDTFSISNFQTYDLKGMEKLTYLVEPLLYYVLHRFSAIVHDPGLLDRLKILWMDEAWKFLLTKVTNEYVIEAGKTWRKSNGGLVLVTQSSTDLERGDLLDVVKSVCPMKLFLADPGADKARYAKEFELNSRELEILTQLTPKRQLVLKTPTHSKLLNLNLDPKSLWLYTTTPKEMVRRRQAFDRYGLRKGLEVLTHSDPEEKMPLPVAQTA
jgi:type IV secretion/conjugal transfer VirB4 family ATPase